MDALTWNPTLSVIGGPYKERWPDEEACIIFISTVFTYSQHLTALTFLYGNLRHVGLVTSSTPLCSRRSASMSRHGRLYELV